jgi:hypothetical protein
MKPLVASLLLACMPSLSTAESIVCGSGTILVGSSSAELEALCGKPSKVNRAADFAGADVRPGIRDGLRGSVDQIDIIVWTYNFGPDQLMQRVQIRNGVVIAIESLGYGYDEP